MTRPTIFRIAGSLAAIAIFRLINFLMVPAATLMSSNAAGAQFADSDAAYVSSFFGTGIASQLGIPTVVLLVILAAIWWKPIMQRRSRSLLPALGLAMLLPGPAKAYYDKSDFAEAYFILPNESAFFIPDVGANKESQAKFGSTEYLEQNKVAAKRFTIPHVRFSGSGVWSDFYVPSGRLIVVDRTPYNREWVAARDRGTSTRNESFPCQSQEGLNITVEVAIAASVTEENAARFLYWFGVRPPAGNRADPQVIFTSVYAGRGLAEVMDTVGRGKVQSLVCHEIGARTFDKVNTDVNAIMDAVQKSSAEFFTTRGITIDYIGWAGTFTFDRDVQRAVNDRYTAEKLAPVLATLETKAYLDALARWDGKLPNNVSGLWLLPTDLMTNLAGLLKKQ
jgi:hypothetical protein